MFDHHVKKVSNVNPKNIFKTRIQLCATHFLKNIIDDVKALKLDNEQRSAYIFAFTLLQNAKTFERFYEILTNIYFFVCNKKKSNLVKVNTCLLYCNYTFI